MQENLFPNGGDARQNPITTPKLVTEGYQLNIK
jgi:hypothetical protein